MISTHVPDFVVLAIIGMPLFGAALLGISALARANAGERVIGRIAIFCVGASALASIWTLVDRLADPTARIVHAFHWLRLPGHEISVGLWIDPLSALMLVMTTVISLVVTWFSVPYLHREPGYLRYFALVLLFVAGMNVLVAGDGFLLLFLGWEWVGVCSALLIGFFHERAAPVRAGARALITNRLGDLGLLTATLFLGHELGGSDFTTMLAGSSSLSPGWATAIGLSLWIAALSKSAQLPVSNWMAHAVEGPTTSTGLFYGAVMAHAGVYLLLRSGPLIVQSPIAMWATVLVGGSTLVVATAIGAAQTDAKGRLDLRNDRPARRHVRRLRPRCVASRDAADGAACRAANGAVPTRAQRDRPGACREPRTARSRTVGPPSDRARLDLDRDRRRRVGTRRSVLGAVDLRTVRSRRSAR